MIATLFPFMWDISSKKISVSHICNLGDWKMQKRITGVKKHLMGAVLAATAAGWAFNAMAEDPLPAEHMPLASKSILLDLADTGTHYVAVGERGHILLSENAKDWSQVDVPVRAMLNSVTFADGNNGWAAGHDAVIVNTKDGGKSWTLQNWDPELQKPILDIFFLDTERGFAVGAYGLLLRTFDGGNTWEQHDDPITEEELHFSGMTRLQDGMLLLVGEAGTLARSLDEGETWEAMESPYEGSYFDVVARGEKGAVMFGLRGNVFVTDDVSAATADTWQRLTSNTVQSFLGGALLPDGGVAIVGVNGVMLMVSPTNSATLLTNPEAMGLSGVIPMREGNTLLVSGEGGTYIFKR